MRIGVLTGGGDVPGLNAALRAIAHSAEAQGAAALGIRNGWLGLLELDGLPLTREAVSGVLPRGGTILGTSRVGPFSRPEYPERVLENLKRLGVDALIVLGGDGTLAASLRVAEMGVRLVGIPKTIDNDVPGTEYCLGFDTAVTVVMEALDKLHPTAEAHHRVMVVEVMGRDAGWVATVGGMAGGADAIVVPEVPTTVEEVCQRLHSRVARSKGFSLVVVAEGARVGGLPELPPEERARWLQGPGALGGVGLALGSAIQAHTSYETRVTVLGYVQRGGSPTATDRVMATRMGAKAVTLLLEGQSGMMVALVNGAVVPVPLTVVRQPGRRVDPGLYELAQLFY